MVNKRMNNAKYLSLMAVLLIFFLNPVALYSESPKQRPHGDKNKLLKGCASCHQGHAKYNASYMLSESKEKFCFRCHGDSASVEKTRREGALGRDTKETGIEREFQKPFRHPVEKAGLHRYSETLPEMDPSAPRHAECGDCHHHHLVTNDNKMSGIMGTSRERTKVSVTSEYELCFNCHSYSANLPADQTNKAELFAVSNLSYHPVIGPGKNRDVPSLILPLTATSQIKCTDCHNNNDRLGPRGPHGSIYRHILARNFTETDGAEEPFQYELCYGCHRRSSILGDESFPYHRLHIVNLGASCRTCHNPHGSIINAHLIDFQNTIFIRPSTSGRLLFTDLGNRAGQCYLNCHEKDHNPAIYPSAPPASKTASPVSKSKTSSLQPLRR